MPAPSYLKSLPSLTSTQHDITIGSLLGDGSLTATGPPPKNYCLQKTQSHKDIRGVDKKDYLEWHVKSLAPYSLPNIRNCSVYKQIKNYKDRLPINVPTSYPVYFSYKFMTHCHSVFTQLADKWYQKDQSGKFVLKNSRRVKIIPNDIKLSPLSLCIWHMDDGYVCQKDANILLNTQGFTWDECEFLMERLKSDLGITSKVRAKQQKPVIYVGRKSYFDFIQMIRPHIKWKCFRYKLDTETYNKLPHRGESHSLSKLDEKQVFQIFDWVQQGITNKEIATRHNISGSAVAQILHGKRWGHMGLKMPRKKPYKQLSESQKTLIIQLNKDGLTQNKIANRLNTTQSTVSRFLNKQIQHDEIQFT